MDVGNSQFCLTLKSFLRVVLEFSTWYFIVSADKPISNTNQVGVWTLSRVGYRRVVDKHRPLRIYALFGGKKDNNDKSNDASSKVCS